MPQKNEWENFFSRNAATEWYPSEPVVRLLCSYKKELGSSGKKVLDLGCGNGRHVWLSAKEGFDSYGIDLAESGVEIARKWLERDGLKFTDLRSGSISDHLPYAGDFFDIIISYGVLDHMPINEAKKAIREAKRTLKPGGILFLKLESNASFTSASGKAVAKNELILDKAVEAGMLQHFFDKEEAADLAKDFTAVKFYREDLRRFDDMDQNYQSRWIFIGKKP